MTGDANDRDSPVFCATCASRSTPACADTARVKTWHWAPTAWWWARYRAKCRAHAGEPCLAARPTTCRSITVWVHLQEAEARRRIQARGNPNDAWKLAHWDDYRPRLFLPTAAQYPELRLYDNTAASAEEYEALLQTLQGPSDSVAEINR